MPLYIEKRPITIVGMGTPFIIPNLFAHRIVDDDTSRIILLSTIGGELNTAQHFGHNSRKISIKGRVNLVTGEGILNQINPFLGASVTGAGIDTVLTGLKFLKETKSAVLVIMNHSICYGIIDKVTITDDREYPTSFDYECLIIEKDLFGLRFSAIAQRVLSGLIGLVTSTLNRERIIEPDRVIPKFVDFRE